MDLPARELQMFWRDKDEFICQGYKGMMNILAENDQGEWAAS